MVRTWVGSLCESSWKYDPSWYDYDTEGWKNCTWLKNTWEMSTWIYWNNCWGEFTPNINNLWHVHDKEEWMFSTFFSQQLPISWLSTKVSIALHKIILQSIIRKVSVHLALETSDLVKRELSKNIFPRSDFTQEWVLSLNLMAVNQGVCDS